MGLINKSISGISAQTSNLQTPQNWLINAFNGGQRKTASKIVVGHNNSMSLSAYYSAIRNISEDIGKLPLRVFQFSRDGSKEHLIENPVNRMFSLQPNPEMSAMTFKEVLTAHALGWGNGYAEIVRNGRGDAVELFPIHPARVEVERDPNTDEIIYFVYDNGNTNNIVPRNRSDAKQIPARDMLHVKGLGADGLIGYSVLQFQAESLGTAIATQQYGGSFFGNGTSLSGILTHPESLGEEARKNLRDSWQQAHSGSDNAYKVAVLEEGVTWKETSVPPVQAQFIETRKFQIEDIARWFRIPPNKIGDMSRMTFNNIEQVSIDYVTDTLTPWITRWEQEIDIKLLNADADNIVGKFMVQTLTRGDIKTRTEHYGKMMTMGVYSINEVREMEDLNPIGEEGDKRFMQTSMTTIDKIGEDEPEVEEIEVEETENEDSQVQENSETETLSGRSESKTGDTLSVLALEPVLLNALEILETKETKAVERQLAKAEDKRGDLVEWADDFYRTQIAYAFKMVDPVLSSFARTARLSIDQENSVKSNCSVFFDELYNSAMAKVAQGEKPEHTIDQMKDRITSIMSEGTK